MTTALVPVFTGTLADRAVQLCDARALHTFMQVKRDFSNWIKGRIRKFGFAAGEDYLLAKSGEQVPHQGGTRTVERIDYHLTLDMAKELAMVENNEQGRVVRRYFIDCERQVQAATRPHNPAIDYDRISPAQAQDLKELVHAIADSKVQGFGETWARLHRKFRVNSYLELPATRFAEARDYLLAKLPEPPATPIDAADAPALAAARKVAMDYFRAFHAAAASGQPAPRMDDIPQDVLEGLVADALLRQKMLVSFDCDTGRMQTKLVPNDASIISLQKGDYTGLVHSVPMQRLPELAEALNKRVASHLGAFSQHLQSNRPALGAM